MTVVAVALSFLLVSCEQDEISPNTNSLAAEELGTVNYRLGSQPVVLNEGFAYQPEGPNSKSFVLTAETAGIECGPGSINWGRIDSYLLSWLEFPDGRLYPWIGTVNLVGNGDTTQAFFKGSLWDCSSEEPEVTITELSDSTLRGTFKAEFYRLGTSHLDSDSTYNTCEFFESVGVLEAEFNVPIVGPCPE